MLDFRHTLSVRGGQLVIATITQAQVQSTTDLLTTCFSAAMNYPKVYQCAPPLVQCTWLLAKRAAPSPSTSVANLDVGCASSPSIELLANLHSEATNEPPQSSPVRPAADSLKMLLPASCLSLLPCSWSILVPTIEPARCPVPGTTKSASSATCYLASATFARGSWLSPPLHPHAQLRNCRVSVHVGAAGSRQDR